MKRIKLGSLGRKIDGDWPKASPAEFLELMRLRELWARAYTQYVVRHVANSVLYAQFEVAASRMSGQYFWPEEEFEAIDLAITTIFTAKSWQPPPQTTNP